MLYRYVSVRGGTDTNDNTREVIFFFSSFKQFGKFEVCQLGGIAGRIPKFHHKLHHKPILKVQVDDM